MQRFGFSFTIILLKFLCSCYFANVWLSKYMNTKELLLDSLCSWCIFCKNVSISYVCCDRLLGKSEEKNTATGVTRTSPSHTELDLAVCDLEYAFDIPGRLTSIQGGDAFISCPISRVNSYLRQREHAAEISLWRHRR